MLCCAQCGAGLHPAIRAGPSGAFRLGATPVACRRCGHVTLVEGWALQAQLAGAAGAALRMGWLR